MGSRRVARSGAIVEQLCLGLRILPFTVSLLCLHSQNSNTREPEMRPAGVEFQVYRSWTEVQSAFTVRSLRLQR